MNKLLVFPIGIMFFISMFLLASASVAPETSSEDYSDVSGISIDGNNRTVLIPAAETQTLNIWLITGALIVVVAGIAVGIVAGITVLGSGVSVLSQKIIVVSFIYLGIWGCLTVITATIMLSDSILTLIWFALSFIFSLGLSSELTGSD